MNESNNQNYDASSQESTIKIKMRTSQNVSNQIQNQLVSHPNNCIEQQPPKQVEDQKDVNLLTFYEKDPKN